MSRSQADTGQETGMGTNNMLGGISRAILSSTWSSRLSA